MHYVVLALASLAMMAGPGGAVPQFSPGIGNGQGSGYQSGSGYGSGYQTGGGYPGGDNSGGYPGGGGGGYPGGGGGGYPGGGGGGYPGGGGSGYPGGGGGGYSGGGGFPGSHRLCGGLPSVSQCCEVNALGIISTRCKNPPQQPQDQQSFRQVCAAQGMTASCCTLSGILDSGLLCHGV